MTQQKTFLENASHELRIPITVIRGFAEVLQNPDLSNELRLEITEKIVRTCARLENLVKSLTLLADIDHLPQERLKKENLIAIVKRCIEQLLDWKPNTKIHFKTKLKSAPILADAGLFEIAVMNLLENAVKYSKGEAEIEVRVEKQGPEIHLHIADRGMGIDEKDLPHIFDRFYVADRTRRTGSAGLGLALVKDIVEKHRGKIRVVSQVGKGSTFTIDLNGEIS